LRAENRYSKAVEQEECTNVGVNVKKESLNVVRSRLPPSSSHSKKTLIHPIKQTKYECNERWRCSPSPYIPYPRSQEAWVKDEKDAHHIHKKNSPTREYPTHNN